MAVARLVEMPHLAVADLGAQVRTLTPLGPQPLQQVILVTTLAVVELVDTTLLVRKALVGVAAAAMVAETREDRARPIRAAVAQVGDIIQVLVRQVRVALASL